MNNETAFLRYSSGKLAQLGGRIEFCLDRLTPEQVWARSSARENAVGNLVLHLSGNVRQWIGSGVAGLPDHRLRDAEFAASGGPGIEELKLHLRETLNQAIPIIEALTPARLAERITVQNYELSVLEAVYHVVEHFSGHTGQIIFAAKLLTGADLGFYKHLQNAAHSETVP